MALSGDPAPPALFLVHGWGFTPDFWQPVRARLGGVEATALDFGFFGPERMTARPAGRHVAVGHSLGALWLLLNPPADCAGMLLINGFARFGATTDYPQGIPPRVIERMARGLEHNPDDVVATFRGRAGIATPAPGPARAERLARALELLRDADARGALAAEAGTGLPPIRVLAGGQDPIAPPAMTEASFRDRVPVEWVEDGGHLLPLTHPDRCAAAIARLIAESGRS
ncbi:alpha/beta fold hydrolase [Gluconacetobacter takamatsuzukensis]|uniref:Alpha/beta fold hydrolase n=1 Tax=Gluconacetobacter takamatsuzukensis TaxID=1286190 RepID=A0A7W4KCC3_9PROT|nr:alpha/beta fold hydrolase [Gluconacetobacter takamatsuzukensis]MBB2204327.1 alpha/beta fold hydrolase [Gluconacetobacter takamatsuzukensis]